MSRRFIAPVVTVLLLLACGGSASPPRGGAEEVAQKLEQGLAAAETSEGPGYAWPIPEGWTTGDFPFPPPFAPTLAGRGAISTRETPGFYVPEDATFWSYDNLWWLEGDPAVSAESLSRDVTAYYRGLVAAFVPAPPPADGITATFQGRSRGGRGLFVGRISTYDPFVTSPPRAIALNAVVATFPCRAANHRAVLFLLSQQPFEAPVWKTLLDEALRFRCARSRPPDTSPAP